MGDSVLLAEVIKKGTRGGELGTNGPRLEFVALEELAQGDDMGAGHVVELIETYPDFIPDNAFFIKGKIFTAMNYKTLKSAIGGNSSMNNTTTLRKRHEEEEIPLAFFYLSASTVSRSWSSGLAFTKTPFLRS